MRNTDLFLVTMRNHANTDKIKYELIQSRNTRVKFNYEKLYY
jgi:hypothetical protein